MPLDAEDVALLKGIAKTLKGIAETLKGIESKRPGEVAQRDTMSRPRVMARSFVHAELSANGPTPWLEILARGAEHGHSKTTLERARRDVAEPQFVDGRHVWRLREDVNHGQGRVDRR